MAIFSASHLRLGYASKVLFPYSISWSWPLNKGRLVALLGRNGRGKSSLLRCIAGLLAPLSGELCYAGRSFSSYTRQELAQLLAFVHTERLDIAYLSLRQLVALGRSPYSNWLGQLSRRDEELVEQALQLVGIEHLAEQYWQDSSDGQKQLALIARALAQDTALLLLDEPTAHLDYWYKRRIFALLRKLAQEENKLILLASHDIELALEYSDEYLCLEAESYQLAPSSEVKAKDLFSDFAT